MARRNGKMTINKVRSKLYLAAKLLGDLQAVRKATRTGSSKPLTDRAARRAAGYATGRFLGKLFK